MLRASELNSKTCLQEQYLILLVSMKRKKYSKPKIISKKIKLSFFLSNFKFIDSFGWVGNVYAQSSGSTGGSSGGDCISGGLESNGGCGCSTSDSNGNAW